LLRYLQVVEFLSTMKRHTTTHGACLCISTLRGEFGAAVCAHERVQLLRSMAYRHTLLRAVETRDSKAQMYRQSAARLAIEYAFVLGVDISLIERI
jgi:hypothetical protein